MQGKLESQLLNRPVGKEEITQSAKILEQIDNVGWDKLLGVNSDFSEINLQATDKASRQHVLNVKLKKDSLEFFADFPLPFAITWDDVRIT